MTDQDKLFKLRNDSSYFSKIYDDYKNHSLNFMRKMNNDLFRKENNSPVNLYYNGKKGGYKLLKTSFYG